MEVGTMNGLVWVLTLSGLPVDTFIGLTAKAECLWNAEHLGPFISRAGEHVACVLQIAI